MKTVEGWTKYSIDECCEILDNKRVPVNSIERELRAGSVPYYGANGLQGFIDGFLFDEDLILIAEDGGNFEEFATRAIAYQISGKSWVNNHAHVLRAKNNFNQTAIFYFLEHKNILPFIVGGTRAKLNQRELKSIEIDLPNSKPEQTKIAEILSCIDTAIEQTEAMIAKQQRIKTGLMQDLLSKGIDEHGNIRTEQTHAFKDSELGRIPVEWDVKTVGDIFSMQLGKMLNKKAVEGKDSAPYLGNKNVQWDYVDLNDLLEMNFNEQEREKFHLKIDDILVCEGGEVGRTALWRGEHESCYFQKAIHRLRPIQDNYLPKLFPLFMKHAISKGIFLNFVSQTSIAHLTQEQLAKLPIILPKIDEQNRIVEFFEQLDKSVCLEKTNLTKLKRQKTALMQDLLSGNVRVNGLI